MFDPDLTLLMNHPEPEQAIDTIHIHSTSEAAVRWFHAIDCPITDPIAIRKEKTLNRSSSAGSYLSPKPKISPKQWQPFSSYDSAALERVTVNEDHLFEVDIAQRTISPIYWEGPVFEVRRAHWFMQGDGSRWIPCQEIMAEQIEHGYRKHQHTFSAEEVESIQAVDGHADHAATSRAVEEKNLEKKLKERPMEKQWNLLGEFIGQYIVFTGHTTAWLLHDTTSGRLAKSIITTLTNHHNLGGTRLLRGYAEVEKQNIKPAAPTTPTAPEAPPTPPTPTEKNGNRDVRNKESETSTPQEKTSRPLPLRHASSQFLFHDQDDSKEHVRTIDHLVFVVHGIGQKMSERTGQNLVHDVNTLRKTIKTVFPTLLSSLPECTRTNGIQVLPILWRNEIMFGTQTSSDEEGKESDLGLPTDDDISPTLDEITLEGVPNIRMVVSDAFLDIPLYMTHKYRDQMTRAISKQANRIYAAFLQRNPTFEKKGKVTIIGHSLGSLLAFDILSAQPMPGAYSVLSKMTDPCTGPEEKRIPLDFPVHNFFALGSPLGILLLLRGVRVGSRKTLNMHSTSDPLPSNVCYPAAENLYNVFHKSDPVAYRLEPLIARHYSIKLKPEPIPYNKGGLKNVIDAGFNVGTDIATKAGAMYESFVSGVNNHAWTRGLGLSIPSTNANANANTNANTKDFSVMGGSELPRRTDTYPPTSLPPASTAYPPQPMASLTPASLRSLAMEATGAKLISMLNASGRVDYCLQEGILENPYLSALSVHLHYWQDLDIVAFLIREIYKH
ncbi:DDHD domain-containing protein [Spinellus fusiger]|nr:DDHD domain-containing protein [Spinellus fusiger]